MLPVRKNGDYFPSILSEHRVNLNVFYKTVPTSQKAHHIIIIIIIITIINIKDWTLCSVPSPKLQLLSPTFPRSSNFSPSFWSVEV